MLQWSQALNMAELGRKWKKSWESEELKVENRNRKKLQEIW